MTTEHLFRIASMTKAVTSVAVMTLVEEGYIALDDPVSKFVPALAELDVLEVAEDGQTIFSVDAVTEGPRLYLSGGGGLVSSADDYLRFCQMLLNRGELDGARILKEESVDLMTRNQIGELFIGFAEDKFGLGFSITQAARDGIPEGVVGWGGFYGSEFWIDTENEIVAVFMSQVYDLPRRNEIVRRFGSEVFRALVTPTSSN